jgi:hypothetical protein
MRNTLRALALTLALLPGLAAAQTFPTVPDHTVLGRIGTGGGSGPSQAIPFATMAAQLAAISLPTPYQFGAVGNGVANDTAAINSAIAATPAWGTLFLPCGTYSVTSSTAQIFLISQNINIVGAGWCAKIVVASGNTAADLFHFYPPAGQNRGWKFDSFAIDSTASSSLSNIFHIDTHQTNTSGMGGAIWNNIQMLGAVNSIAMFFDNPSSNVNGGAFQVRITNNEFGGSGSGLITSNSGDSFWVEHNFFYANQFAISVYQISGAGNFSIINNSIISACQILIKAGIAPIIRDNIIEQEVTNTCNDNAQIDINGDILGSTIQSPQIIGNQIQVPITGVGNPVNISLSKTDRTFIDGNTLRNAASVPGIFANTDTTNNRYGINTFLGSMSQRIDDVSTGSSFKYVTTGASDNN